MFKYIIYAIKPNNFENRPSKRRKENDLNSNSELVCKKKTNRKRWTSEKNGILLREFKEFIESKRDPPTEMINNVPFFLL